jgi:hypothetical protein
MSSSGLDPVPQLVVRAGLSLLFAWAALHKLRNVERFRAALEGYDLVPERWTVPFGAGLIAVEVGVAAGLWLPGVSSVASVAAAGLLLLYASAIGVNLVRGRREIDCGCAGPADRRPISGALVVRNGVLAFAALAGAWPGASRSLTWLDGVTVAAAVVSLVCLYAAVDGLLATADLGGPPADGGGAPHAALVGGEPARTNAPPNHAPEVVHG